MPDPELVPKVVAGVTLVAGAALLAAPRQTAEPSGLAAQTRGVRAVGLADLLLVPGLASGRNLAGWMTARAAVSVMQSAYLDAAAASSTRPGAARGAARVLAGLAVMDAVTALQLRARRA